MITESRLKKIADQNQINPFYQEKDYLQNIFLLNLSRKDRKMVFKGGTCLKFCYGLPRYSEDLDFNTELQPEEVEGAVGQVLKSFKKTGIEYRIARSDTFEEESSYTAHIRFQGPLYRGIDRSENQIQVDAGYRQGTVLEPEPRQVSTPYPDIPNYFVETMQLEEILAEKIDAMSNRQLGRDLFDIWFVLDIAEIKRSLVQQKLGRDIRFPTEQEYQRDLSDLTHNPPSYGPVRRQVEEKLEEAGLL